MDCDSYLRLFHDFWLMVETVHSRSEYVHPLIDCNLYTYHFRRYDTSISVGGRDAGWYFYG